MKKIFRIYLVALVLLVFISCGRDKNTDRDVSIPPYLTDYSDLYLEDPRKANLEWFKNAKYGLFMHYGVYSSLEDGEWIQLRHDPPIAVADYDTLKRVFTARNFDADFIADLAAEAGMKYINITSRHHDSFSLFKTGQSDFNSVDAPNCRRDLVGELAKACDEKGLGLFLYYSYGADWKHPYFYPRSEGWVAARPDYAEPQPEYKFKEDEDFQHYIDFVHAQLKELLTQYPNIAGIWFDPIMGFYSRPDLFPIEETYALVRSMSPHALISFKQGANGDEDFSAPERGGGAKVGQQFDVAKKVYELNKNKPKEVCNTLQPHAWGYRRADDGKHKTADDVMAMLHQVDSIGANLLLNVGPLPDGSFPQEDIMTLKEVGKRLKENPLW
ncbi:MAG: alpha-L-fucosidase [Cytophagales bacterium]|nr:alpha-L-fucosidase [Cytophagales bacterium]